MPAGDEYDEERLGKSRECIRLRVIEGYDYWFSLECDIIIPPYGLKVLHEIVAKYNLQSLFHYYPLRQDKNARLQGIGCALFTREFMGKITFAEGLGLTRGDPYMQDYAKENFLPMAELAKVIPIEHLAG
jgi:hypothetical protein